MPRRIEFDVDIAIEDAMHEIWRCGYEAVSVKRICDRLGITRSSFYNAFGSREAFFARVVDTYFQGAPESMLMTLTPDSELAPALTSVVREVCRVRAADPDSRGCLVCNTLGELLPGNPKPGATVERASNAILDRLDQLVSWAKDRGELGPNTEVRSLALALHSMLMGINMQSKYVRSERDLWRSASTTLRALGLLSGTHD